LSTRRAFKPSPRTLATARDEGFAIALLRVKAGKFTLSVGSDLDGETVVGQVFSRRGNFTDCPAGDWKFYLVYDGERITCCPPNTETQRTKGTLLCVYS